MAKATKSVKSAVTVAPSATGETKRGYTGPFTAPVTGKITVVQAAPKVAGSKGAKRYSLYRNGMTVQQYLDASNKAGNRLALAKADVMWDYNHEFITIGGFSLKPLGAPVRGRGAAKAAEPAKVASKSRAKSKAKPENRATA